MMADREEIYDFVTSGIVAAGTSVYFESFFAAVCAGLGALVVRHSAKVIKEKFFK